MNALQTFDFEGAAVRTVLDDDLMPWFVARDVCQVLEVGNPTMALRRLEKDEKGLNSIETLGGAQELNTINESGLYALIFTSRKPAAKRFRKWVTGEVLPALRRTGRYEMPPAATAQPESVMLPEQEETRLWLNMISQCRLIHGRDAARWLWAQSPLPHPPAAPRIAAPGEDGPGCLARLLAHVPDGWDRSIGDALAAPEGERRSWVKRLRRVGIITGHHAHPDAVIVANVNPVLGAAFVGTEWEGGWRRALLALPGASCSARTFSFGGRDRQSRAVALPLAMVTDEAVGAG